MEAPPAFHGCPTHASILESYLSLLELINARAKICVLPNISTWNWVLVAHRFRKSLLSYSRALNSAGASTPMRPWFSARRSKHRAQSICKMSETALSTLDAPVATDTDVHTAVRWCRDRFASLRPITATGRARLRHLLFRQACPCPFLKAPRLVLRHNSGSPMHITHARLSNSIWRYIRDGVVCQLTGQPRHGRDLLTSVSTKDAF